MSNHARTILLIFAVFALHPLALGAWLAHIPEVKTALNLSKSELAVALLGLPAATIPGMQVASRVISAFGPRRIMMVMFPLQAVTVLLPLMATGQATLFFALMGFGVSMAFLQVCLNVYAGRFEKQMGRAIMNRSHGVWALGLMAGPLMVAALPWLGRLTVVAIISISSGVAAAWIAQYLPRLTGDDAGSAPRRPLRQIPLALIAISLFALAVSMTEGAMADWAAVYLAERLPEGSNIVGLGVSIYAGFLALGRLNGDWLKNRLGPTALARATYLCAICGLVLLILPLPLSAAFVGFALVGAGASVGFPLGVSAAAALDNRYESQNIAIMSSVAICGFLIGPPIIGFLADAYSLKVGLSALLPVLVIGFVLAGALERKQQSESG